MMTTISNPRLRGRRIEPVEWRVRAALSPFWLGWGLRYRWWSLLVCDEGLAAFEWPSRKHWAMQLRLGFRAGLGALPLTVAGDSWPLSERAAVVESRSALLFPWGALKDLEVRRRRFLANSVRVFEQNGQSWTFTAADPLRVEEYANVLGRHFGVTKSGHWRQAV
jgi:hypothetical protein